MSINILATLPWESNDTGLIHGQCQGDHDDAPFIADVCDSPLDYTPHEQAKAEFITRACNAHADLLNALEALLIYAADVLPAELDGTLLVWNQAEAAVAKAKRGP